MSAPHPREAGITASIVSHGHGAQVVALLGQLAGLGEPRLRRVMLTLNVPEPALVRQIEAARWPFDLQLLHNAVPLGFGANHNQACARDGRAGDAMPCFAVLNPDLQLLGNPFPALCQALAGDARVGVAYPVQRDAAGRRQDFERLLPTPARLLRRHLLRRPTEVLPGALPDWVNAAFLLVRRSAWEEVGGFDTAYHMYCEDVDLCLRLRLAGWHLACAEEAMVTHQAQRASRRQWRHLAWHARSLWRLWRSPAWRAYRATLQRGH